MDYAIGSRIGDYEILAVLGAGGMGKVYKVQNVLTDRQEALKVLLMNAGEEQDLADRFLREIKVTARLTHRHIAGLHTALRIDNQVLMVMEYVEGTTLERLLKPGPVPYHKAVELMCQVLDALQYAHNAGVVHRDLKPANIMVTAEGQVKLLDFGIAKLKQDQSLTKTGFTVGSLPYMSPEQIEGATDLDHRADIYALGISLYEMVTGRRPFLGDSDYSLMVAHLKQAPVPPIEIDPRLPQGLNDIILTAIEKDRTKRFQSAGAMLRAMTTLLENRGHVGTAAGTSTATMATPVVPVPPPVVSAPPSIYAPPPLAATPAPEYPSPPVAPVPVGKPLGQRGLYIAIGSIVTVVVLVLAAVQIPKYFQTRAGGETTKAAESHEQTPPQPQPATQPEQTPQTLPSQAASDPVGTPTRAQTDPGQPPTPRHQVAAQPQAGRQVAEETSRAKIYPVGQASQNPQTQSATSGNPALTQNPPVTPPVTQPAVDSARQEELRSLRESLMLLGTRANSIKSSLESLKQAQARQGLGLRGDINTAEQQMEYFLDECEGAQKRGDAAAAKRYLQMAERQVAKLEDFLGR